MCNLELLVLVDVHKMSFKFLVIIRLVVLNPEGIDLKRITRCKLALIFTSADHRKFLGLFWF